MEKYIRRAAMMVTHDVNRQEESRKESKVLSSRSMFKDSYKTEKIEVEGHKA